MSTEILSEQGAVPTGFIEDAEVLHFRTTVRDVYSGEGVIVDAGSFMGDSTCALYDGVPVSLLGSEDPSVIAIDRFVVGDRYLHEFFIQRGMDIRRGESFLPHFLRRLGHRTKHIEVRAGDVFEVGRIERPIEVLMIDLAKSSGLNAYVMGMWFPRLIAGHSIVLHQDLHSPTLPWIAVSMGYLLDYFELTVAKVGECATFRLVKAIPTEVLRTVQSLSMRDPMAIPALDRLIRAVPDDEMGPLLLHRSWLLWQRGMQREAREQLRRAIELPTPTDRKWAKWISIAASVIDPSIFGENSVLSEAYYEFGAQRMGE